MHATCVLFRCVHNKVQKISCRPGTLFNEVISSCDHPQNVDCNGAPQGQGGDNGGTPDFEPDVAEDQHPVDSSDYVVVDNPVNPPPPPKPLPGISDLEKRVIVLNSLKIDVLSSFRMGNGDG